MCSLAQQRVPGRHHITAKKRWSKEVNIVIMECYYRSNPIEENGVPLKGYRQIMYREWLTRGPFGDATEQRICQSRTIKQNVWLTEVEQEIIKRKINTKGPQETDQENNQGVEDSFPDSDELVVRAKLSIFMNEASKEEIIVVNEVKEIYDIGENAEGMIF